MKSLVVLAVLAFVVLVGFIFWLQYEGDRDKGHLVALACGNPRGDVLELQVVVSMRMVRLDPLKLKENGKFQTMREWVEEHFELRDAAGAIVPLKREHFANLIPQAKVGTPDSYLLVDLKPSTDYSLDYRPIGPIEGKSYRVTFNTGTEGLPFARQQLDLVPESVN